MARTIRRKGVKPDIRFAERLFCAPRGIRRWYTDEVAEKIYAMPEYHKYLNAVYHSDKCTYNTNSVPKGFRKYYTRRDRRASSSEVLRILRDSDFEAYEFQPRNTCAGWYYW